MEEAGGDTNCKEVSRSLRTIRASRIKGGIRSDENVSDRVDNLESMESKRGVFDIDMFSFAVRKGRKNSDKQVRRSIRRDRMHTESRLTFQYR